MLSGIKILGEQEVRAKDKEMKREKKEREKKRKREKKEKSKRRKREKQERLGKQEPGDMREESDSSACESASSDEEEQKALQQRVSEEGSKEAPAAAVRESWMSDVSLFSKRLQDAKAREEDAKIKEEAERAKEEENKVSARELNPYFKDGGRGLPPEEQQSDQQRAESMKTKVGDGGLSWRMKALKRAKEQASDQGLHLDEVVSERWGSVSSLAGHITSSSGRASHAMAHQHAARDRTRAGEGEGRRGERSHYLEDMSRDRPAMRRPRGDISSSWKRRGDGDGGRRPAEEAVWERPSPAGERGAVRSPNRDEASHQRGRDREGGRGGERKEGAGKYQRPPGSDLLHEVAGTMNKFAGDGSFLDSFQAGHTSAQVERRPQEEEAYSVPGRYSPSQEERRKLEEPAPSAPALEHAGKEGGGEAAKAPASSNTSVAEALRNRLRVSATAGDASGVAATGNKSVADALRARLAGKVHNAAPSAEQRVESVVLPMVDSQGRAAPGAFGRKTAGADAVPEGNRIPKAVQRYGADGAKERYFRDDDTKTLDDLVKEQRYEGVQDMDRNLAQNITRKAKYKGKELDVDDEYDHDGGVEMYEDRRKKGSKEKQNQRSKAAQVADYKRMQSAQDRCMFCFGGQARERVKHLTVAIGQSAYLMLPAAGRLVAGHCQISTVEHTVSSRATDEHVWTEIRNFKKCLLQMFGSKGQDVVFLETAMHLNSGRGHAVIDCIPVPEEVGADAPIFFKQGLDEAESEWSQHHAKRIIDTSSKGLRGSIPTNFAYFHVEFGLSGGYAHIIDDEEKWNKNFGRDMLIGMLGLPEERWHQRARQESTSVQVQWVQQFSTDFHPYDWTRQL